MSGISLIYITFGLSEGARRIALTLLQEKLIACANHLAPIVSHYEWQDEFYEEQEYPALLKPTESKLKQQLCDCANFTVLKHL